MDGVMMKFYAAAVLSLAVLRAGRAQTANLSSDQWYPETNAWPNMCRETIASPTATDLTLTDNMVGERAIVVTNGTLDDFKWTVRSSWKGDCEKESPADCKRATVEVRCKDCKKELSHSVTDNNVAYIYGVSELHVPGEHKIGGAIPDAELQIRFKSTDDKWLAIVVGFKSDNAGAEDEFLAKVVTTLAKQGTSEAGKGSAEVTVGKKDAEDDFAKLNAYNLLKKAMEKDVIIYDGSETHPECLAQKMVVVPEVIKIPAAQARMLSDFVGVKTDAYAGNARGAQGTNVPTLRKAKLTKPKSGGNAGAIQSPRIPFVVAGSLLAATAVAAM